MRCSADVAVYWIYIFLFIVVSFLKVAEKSYCDGKEVFRWYTTLNACASVCKRVSEMFVLGTNQFGTSRCSNGRCKCYCQFSTTNYKCNKRKSHNGYNLYAYKKPLGNCYVPICSTVNKIVVHIIFCWVQYFSCNKHDPYTIIMTLLNAWLWTWCWKLQSSA